MRSAGPYWNDEHEICRAAAATAALQALAELLDLGSADAGMTTDLDPLIVTALPGIGIKKRTREGVARSQAPPRSSVCVPGT